LNNLIDNLSAINLVITFALLVGGILAYRSAFSKTANEVQERVISAMESEINTLRGHISDLKRENKYLMAVLDIIIESLEKRGLIITIEHSSVTIEDQTAHTTRTTRIDEHE
jgi:hypothetical protein